jgi:HPt (histidine-containing phosphotransfer) domain-containing protein
MAPLQSRGFFASFSKPSHLQKTLHVPIPASWDHPWKEASMNAPAFDLNPLLEAVSGDRETMSQVISMFISSTRADVDVLRDAIAKNDGKAVKSTAHHLKGSLLEMNAQALVALTLKLEQLGAAQQLAEAYPLWQELDVKLRSLVALLDETEYRRTA